MCMVSYIFIVSYGSSAGVVVLADDKVMVLKGDLPRVSICQKKIK